MAIVDRSILCMLRSNMQWHKARHTLIAEKVSNAGLRPRHLDELEPTGNRAGALRAPAEAVIGRDRLARTDASTIGTASADGQNAEAKRSKEFEIRPSGNGVNFEEEIMMKAGEDQGDYQLAASLYQKSLETLKIAIGKR